MKQNDSETKVDFLDRQRRRLSVLRWAAFIHLAVWTAVYLYGEWAREMETLRYPCAVSYLLNIRFWQILRQETTKLRDNRRWMESER